MSAIPFIQIDDDQNFILTPEALSFLSTLDPQRKVKPVVIAGPYRTGKSYLANRILN